MKKLIKGALAALIATTAFSANADIIVDDFSVNQAEMSDNTADGSGFYSEVCGANILGGCRGLFITKTSGDRAVRMDVSGGTFAFSEDTGAFGIGVIRWDGDSGAAGNDAAAAMLDGAFMGALNATGLGGVNLMNQGSAFRLVVTSADLNFKFQLQAYTNAGNFSVLELTSTGPGVYMIPFALFGFGFNVGDGADFSNIGALQALINVGGLVQDVDLQLDIVQVVPEPAAIALMGLGLLGLGMARRRKAA